MHDLILLIHSFVAMITAGAFFILLAEYFARYFKIKPIEQLLTKIRKPTLYIFLTAGFLYIIFSLRLIMQ